jgi:DNA-binding NarL/FixJ family response regulator
MNEKDEIRIVLMAENEPFLRAITSFITRRAGLKIVGTFGGDGTSLKRVQSLRPQVILLDMDMTSQNGLATINRLRALLPRVALVALSLLDSQGFRRATLAAGADDLVHKLDLSTALFPAIYRAANNAGTEGDSNSLELHESGLSKM